MYRGQDQFCKAKHSFYNVSGKPCPRSNFIKKNFCKTKKEIVPKKATREPRLEYCPPNDSAP